MSDTAAYIKSNIHGLRVKIGLRKSWQRTCLKNNRIGQAEYAQEDIDKWQKSIERLLILLNKTNNENT